MIALSTSDAVAVFAFLLSFWCWCFSGAVLAPGNHSAAFYGIVIPPLSSLLFIAILLVIVEG